MGRYLHKHFRKKAQQLPGTTYNTLALESGIRLKYATTPNGSAAIMEARFPRADFTHADVLRWLVEHDEVALAVEAKLDGPVFVRLNEVFAGIDEAARPSVDHENHIVHKALVCGWESLNGRSYRPVLRRATGMYDGRPVSLNHPDPKQGVQVESRFGIYKSPKLDDKYGVRADLHFNPKHRYAEQLVWAMENQPSTVCNSHRINAVGQRNRETGIFEVTDIDQIFGVELVGEGGTTSSMFEHIQDLDVVEGDDDDRKVMITKTEDDDMELEKLTMESLRSSRPDLIEQVIEALKAEKEYKDLIAERDALKKQVGEFEEKIDGFEAAGKLAERKTALLEQCTEAKLPKELVTDTFIESLLKYEAADSDGIAAAIKDRQGLAANKPTSRTRTASEAAGDNSPVTEGEKPKTAEQFVESITGE